MIRTIGEYKITRQRLEENRSAVDETRMDLQAESFSPDEIHALLQSLRAIERQLRDDLAAADKHA